MNRSHRSLYNAALGAWVAAPETARSTRKGRGKAGAVSTVSAAVALAAFLTTPALALDANTLPTGGQVSAGAGSLSTSGNTLTVNQTSQKLSIDWSSFSIGSAATVNFVQPGASAIALNRVTGSDPSQIYGNLNANGQVFLLNPNGVLFAKGAEVNVGGLVASTLSLSNADFMAGNYRFSGKAGSVLNQGDISVADKGYVALLGGQVSNEGTIVARLGSVHLAAGSDITLDFAGDGLINLQVNQGAVNALAENRQLIRADGGAVLMTATAADALIRAVVNNEGVIEARTVDTSSGTIKLLADMDNGVVNVGGTLDASAPSTGNGGFIETSGQKVTVADSAIITTESASGTTGTWLIDPTDFTISSGSATLTTNGIGADTLAANLANTSVTIVTDNTTGADKGDINVNAAVSWSTATTLTLKANNDININAAMTGTNGGLSLSAGNGISATAAVNVGTFDLQSGTWRQVAASLPTFSATDFRISGGTFIRALSGDGTSSTPYQLADIYGVQGIGSSGMLSGHYVLGSNIDASATSGWNGGAGFVPIGDSGNNFTGVFDGLGHTISGLTINRPSTDYVGLFGTSNGTLHNVGLTAASVSGNETVGGLVGFNLGGISNSYVSGSVSGNNYVGGLVGRNEGGSATISNSYVTGSVRGRTGVGGLVGVNDNATISNSYVTGSVRGTSEVGGLVGDNFYATISNSYATGPVRGAIAVGGLVGRSSGMDASISNSYASGTVSGYSFVGGLVGENAESISNSYATGSVSGTDFNVGGLVGMNHASGTVSNSYAAGWVSGTDINVGGLVGKNEGSISNSFFGTASTGQSSACGYNSGTCGASGLDTDGMKTASNFSAAGWSISSTGGSSSIWRIYDDQTAPLLRSFLTPLTIAASGGSMVYNGTTNAGAALSYSTTTDASLLLGTLSASTSSKDVGRYNASPSGLFSSQQGYDISYGGGTVNITPAPLSITANDASRTTNGAAYAGGNGVSYAGFVGGETDGVLGGALAYTGASQGAIDPGTYAITPGGLTSGNYAITFVNGRLTILPVTPTSTASPGAPYVAAVYVADTVGQTTHPGTSSASATAQLHTPPPAPAGGDLAFQTGSFSQRVIDGGMRLPVGLAREALPSLAANVASGND